MRYITLSGVDGSGKTTQLALLKDYFQENGKKVAIFNAVEFSLANRIARFFKGEKSFKPSKDKAVTKASWISIILREKFLFVDMIRFRFLRAGLKRSRYDYLLSDRSFYDSIINIEYLTLCHSERRRKSLLFRLWIPACAGMASLGLWCIRQFLPHSDIAFYFDIDAETIMRRKRVPEQGKEYLHEKISLFIEKTSDWKMTLIDARKNQESVFQEILKQI
jgi:thymidylate kinase